MRPVSTGTQKISMKTDDYEAQKRAAMSQHGQPNPYQAGIQEVFRQGAGEEISKSRTNYGAVTEMPQEVLEGQNSDFAQDQNPGNIGSASPMNTTGNVDNEVSATTVPQEDPSEFQTDALAKRIEMMKGTMPQGESSLNRREQTMRG